MFANFRDKYFLNKTSNFENKSEVGEDVLKQSKHISEIQLSKRVKVKAVKFLIYENLDQRVIKTKFTNFLNIFDLMKVSNFYFCKNVIILFYESIYYFQPSFTKLLMLYFTKYFSPYDIHVFFDIKKVKKSLILA